MSTQPAEPAERTGKSPRFVFLICLAAALVSAIWVLGLLTIVAAVALVVTAMVRQSRGKDPATLFAAGSGVAAGTLVYLLIVLITGQ